MKLLRNFKKIAGMGKIGMIASIASLGIGAGVIGGVGVTYGPEMLKKAKSENSDDTPVVIGEGREPEEDKAGFVLGDFNPGDPVESIKVTLKVGADGEELKEKVDLHLGTGFPLRLYPLGDDSREPAFAAFPQKSSLERGQNSIEPGKSATFEFAGAGESGQDALKSTPQLLKDLTLGDLDTIGFASSGQSNWILEGYSIEVNGKLFASHDSTFLEPMSTLDEKRTELAAAVPGNEALLKEIATLEAYIATGLASEADQTELTTKKAEIAKSAGPLNLLAGQTAGYYPWYVEENEKFVAAVASKDPAPVTEVEVTLVAGGGDKAGTKNPMYIKAGGKKFLLTSESDPLADMDEPQEFTISLADLKTNPLGKNDLENLGIGVVGNEERFGTVPDRAKLQRLVISADGKKVYDSESKTSDRKALETYWLVPPVHLDATGKEIENQEKEDEKYLWVVGMVVPDDVIKKEIIKELEVEEVIDLKHTEELAVITVPPVPILDDLDEIIETPDLKVKKEKGKAKGSTGDSLVINNTVPPPLPDILSTTTNTTTPANTTTTAISGSPSGTFVSTGQVNPSTGLIGGVFVPGGQSNTTTNISPFRRTTTGTGGLSPVIFSTGNNQNANSRNALTPAEIAQITSSLANIIRPFTGNSSTTSTTTNSPPALQISNVRFEESSGDVHAGDSPVIKWDAINTTNVATFEVTLMPFFPHARKGPGGATIPAGIAPGSSPVGRGTATVGATSTTAGPILINATTMGSIPQSEWLHMYIQPIVTAKDSAGNTTGGAQPGAVIPLLPKKGTNSGIVNLQRGIQRAPNGLGNTSRYTFPKGNGYQVFNNTNPLPVNSSTATPMDSNPLSQLWVPFTVGVPTASTSVRSATRMLFPRDSLSGFKFFPKEASGVSSVFNTAVATNSTLKETVLLPFEGVIQYDTANASQMAISGSGVRRGYRVIANLGFLKDGRSTSTLPGNALVGAQVELSSARRLSATTQSNVPGTFSRNGNYTPASPNNVFFSIRHSGLISVSNSTTSPMALIDIPIRFDQLDSIVGGTPVPYEPGTPVGNYNPPNILNPASIYATAKTLEGKMTITVTLFVETPNGTGSLGVFGLRVVPDVYY